MILTDKMRLTQILLNICGNAVKFTHQGSVSIQVSTTGPILDGSQRLQFVIADTGIGIPEEKKELIFDRFVQASETTSSQFGGTGLGLSISRALVTLLGGTLQLESKVGEGTRFTLEFDFPVHESSPSQVDMDQPEMGLAYLATLKVLAAEDNLLNQKLLSAVFNRVGTSITMVSNGLEAVELLGKESFDVIIMDVQMPIMDGYAAIKHIRNILKLDTPIITMTAHAMIGEKEEGFRIGANSYISKPFKEQELFKAITQLTQQNQINPIQASNDSAVKNHLQESETLVDTNYLTMITGGDFEFRNELIELFESDSSRQSQVINDAYQNTDYEALRKAIHSLRSSLISVALLRRLINLKK